MQLLFSRQLMSNVTVIGWEKAWNGLLAISSYNECLLDVSKPSVISSWLIQFNFVYWQSKRKMSQLTQPQLGTGGESMKEQERTRLIKLTWPGIGSWHFATCSFQFMRVILPVHAQHHHTRLQPLHSNALALSYSLLRLCNVIEYLCRAPSR